MPQRTSIVVEEYLQVIYSLIQSAEAVKAVQLGERLKSSPSTVHSTLARMQRDDLILIDSKKNITFTPNGEQFAEDLTRRHRMVEYFLCEKLGIPWHEVHQHAHILEHGLTPLVEEKLSEFLGFPKFCPHGTPMPGEADSLPAGMVFLDQLQEGQKFEVVMISEDLEDSPEVMKYLQDNHIKPKQQHSLQAINPLTQSCELSHVKGVSSIPPEVAKQIGVLPLG